MQNISRQQIISFFSILLSAAIGIVFLFSAYAKFPVLEQFGWTVVEHSFFNWTFAEWFTRALVGLELFFGILFLISFRLKRIAIPGALLLLLVFSVYLGILYIEQGNTGNCGCFGDMLPMTPMESLVKNAILGVALIVLYFIVWEWRSRWDKLILAILFAIALALPIYKSPPESIYIWPKQKQIHIPIPLHILYDDPKRTPPSVNLRNGKHVIAFMSLTCEHCKKAAKKMRIIYEKDSTLPFYFVLNGDTSNLKNFFLETKATRIPYTHFNGVQQFLAMAGDKGVPSIRWVKDTVVQQESNYILLDENEIRDWLREP